MKIINNVIKAKGNQIEYFVSPQNLTSLFYSLQNFAYLMKIKKNNEILLQMSTILQSESTINNTLAFAIIPNTKILDSDGVFRTIKDMLLEVIGEEAYNALPRMTEEQFYDLTQPTE